MGKSKAKTPLRSKSVKELVDFFEIHDMGDYWEKMPKAHFDVDIKKRSHLVALEEDVVDKLTEIAKSKKVSSESLINTWLKDKIKKGWVSGLHSALSSRCFRGIFTHLTVSGFGVELD